MRHESAVIILSYAVAIGLYGLFMPFGGWVGERYLILLIGIVSAVLLLCRSHPLGRWTSFWVLVATLIWSEVSVTSNDAAQIRYFRERMELVRKDPERWGFKPTPCETGSNHSVERTAK